MAQSGVIAVGMADSEARGEVIRQRLTVMIKKEK